MAGAASQFLFHSSPRTAIRPSRASAIRAGGNNNNGKETGEIRVCTNRTCRKQGSFQTLEILTGIAPPSVSVNSSGCLGRCGAGPNVAVLPRGLIRNHCGTAAQAASLMCESIGASSADVANTLEAFTIRKRAEAEMEKGDFAEAEILLSRAIGLKPFGGLHIMLKFRSAARLGTGDNSGALEDARKALELAPRYPEAYLCEGDAFMAMEQYDAAEESYSICLQIEPTMRRSKSFKKRVSNLQEKLTASEMP
ncbi:unnamed protein product [Linum tenue]|uniref:Uncharacterized protein n=1 Tax=Linum tenue TaxID=586396 RepID=A0AAV0L1X4_9ROSI|nr:unnamed protein product [Linum tenue]